MAENYLVTLNNTFFLTDTGLSDGMPCRFKVGGLAGLRGSYNGETVVSANNTPTTFVVPNIKKGAVITLSPLVITKDVLDDIEEIIDDAFAEGDTIHLELEDGALGDFDLEVTGYFANGVRPINFGEAEFVDDFIYGIVISVVVAG